MFLRSEVDVWEIFRLLIYRGYYDLGILRHVHNS